MRGLAQAVERLSPQDLKAMLSGVSTIEEGLKPLLRGLAKAFGVELDDEALGVLATALTTITCNMAGACIAYMHNGSASTSLSRLLAEYFNEGALDEILDSLSSVLLGDRSPRAELVHELIDLKLKGGRA